MINNLKYFLFIVIFFLHNLESVNANESFVFNVTEIEILENGNQINGYKGGTAISEDGSKIIGENFFYNKLTNILEVIGNVKYLDKTKNLIITTLFKLNICKTNHYNYCTNDYYFINPTNFFHISF